MEAPILAPAASLVLWSMVILFWIVSTRFPALGLRGATGPPQFVAIPGQHTTGSHKPVRTVVDLPVRTGH